MKRQPGYEQRSKEIAAECANEEVLKKIREEIFKDLDQSLACLKEMRFSDDENIALRAVKEHLTLAGLYVEKVEHTGKNGQPIIVQSNLPMNFSNE